MATFTLTADPGAAYIGTEGDDTFIIPSYEAWIAAGRVIDGRGGTDTLDFRFRPTALNLGQVVDADFVGVANMESMTWNAPGGGLVLAVTMAALASLSFASGLTLSGNTFTLKGSGLTVPVRAISPLNGVETGSGNDTVTGFVTFASASTGAGNDVVNFTGAILSPFSGGGLLDGGPGYDILNGLGPATTNATWVTATSAAQVFGFEEIWIDKRFDLLVDAPTALTGLDGHGDRNPLVLRPAPFVSAMQVFASGDGRASYGGRIVAFGGANGDTVRGSSAGDYIDAGPGGGDSLSGEGGNDWLVFQNAGHLGGAVLAAGGAGYDILALKDASQTVTDAAFAKAQGIEELRLLGGGDQVVTLGANSDAAFAASSFGAGSVSAAGSTSLTLNAESTSRALSIYGTNGFNTIRAGTGADYIELANGTASTIRAGAGADHVRYTGSLGSPMTADGGAGYDVLMLDSAAIASLGGGQFLSGFEEIRLMAGGAINLSLTGLSAFGGSETGYGTIQAPNAASLALNLRAVTIGISVYGTPGADVITATATANDYLVGGAGADQFRFDGQCAVDVVADFVSGTDKLALIGFAGVTDFAAVQARAAVVGGNLQIGLSPTDAVILAGVTSVAAGDFIFG